MNMPETLERYAQFSRAVEPQRALLRERLTVAGLVVLLHASVSAAWLLQAETPLGFSQEMSVSISLQQDGVGQPQISPQSLPRAIAQPVIEHAEFPSSEQVVREMAEAAPQPLPAGAPPLSSAAPAVAASMASSEPDYSADYLNNPHPTYPLVARRMGYHGTVTLNVEVLLDGRAGQVLLHTSSGYAALDNAALRTVQGWHFTPARQAGRVVTKWFLVPINFILKDKEA